MSSSPRSSSASNRGSTQPTISSYFNRSTDSARPAWPDDPSQGVIDLTDEIVVPPSKRRRLSSDEEILLVDSGSDDGASRSASMANAKQIISPFFAPRRQRSESQDEEAKGRRKAAITKAIHPALHLLSKFKAPLTQQGTSASEHANGTGSGGQAFEQFSVSSTAPLTLGDDGDVQKEEARVLRHQEWERRLNDPRGLIPRRRSLTLDEAAAKAAREEGGDGWNENNAQAIEDGEDIHTQGIPSSSVTRKPRAKRKEELGPAGLPYTPLEKQYIEIKAANPDVMILMEGTQGQSIRIQQCPVDDQVFPLQSVISFDSSKRMPRWAHETTCLFERSLTESLCDEEQIASKELGIAAFPLRNFYSASIPTHRLPIHVKKLVEQGYLVGVVRQTETAALKAAGDNRSKPFSRKLTNLYTAATYVDQTSTDDSDIPSVPKAVLCLDEKPAGGLGIDERVRITILAVLPQTGDVLFDEFDDGHLRTELETRFAHVAPSEVIVPERKLSEPTEKLITFFAGSSRSGTAVRFERKPFPDYSSAAKEFAPSELNSSEGEMSKSLCIVAAAAARHLDRFGLSEPVKHISNFKRFTERAHMILSANTLANLEVFRNNTDFRARGSLMWILDKTRTRMGRRLLREWIGRPLTTVFDITARLEAIEEITQGNSVTLEKLKGLLTNMPDLSRGLARISYAKATPSEIVTLLSAFQRMGAEFDQDIVTGVPKSALLASIVRSLPELRSPIASHIEAIKIREAHNNAISEMFRDQTLYPDLLAAKAAIAESERSLRDYLAEVKQLLRRAVMYSTVAGIEYLIELRQKEQAPDDWVKVSSTKHYVRYHTPYVLEKKKQLEQARESLSIACDAALVDWQATIAADYETFREAIVKLSTFDCLQSLAEVAFQNNFTKPLFVDRPCLKLRGLRHPMAEAMMSEAFVPNDVDFSEGRHRTLIITGPNTSGKSTCVRATALALIMAQIGSFVPAESAELSVHDGVFTRMGASDDIGRGKSTFMVELTEASDILRRATSRSLVILDELGRGTSTHDGSAIAFAVLDKLVEIGSTNMFITHFPSVAIDTVGKHPSKVGNFHMDFAASPTDSKDIVCLYKLVPGLASRSFGVWVGRLAGLPENVLARAQYKGDELRLKARSMAIRGQLQSLCKQVDVDAAQAALLIAGAKNMLMG